MDSFDNSINYSFPVHWKDHSNDMKNFEANAKQALQSINSLYGEIMNTNSHEDFELANNIDFDESPSTSTPITDKKLCTANINKFAETSRKFYFRSQLPLAHCFDCHNRYKDNNNIANRSMSIEENFISNSEIQHANKTYTVNSKSSKGTIKMTVPQPFNLSGFDEQRLKARECKIAKLKQERDQQIDKELNVKIVSKPVPKHTHRQLYNEMVVRNEKRKNERKEESLKIFGKASKSLPLEDFKISPANIKPKTHSLESKSCFKATPVPKNILSDKLSEKIKSKEEIRKMLIAHRAEEMLKQASSPLSKKTISRSYSMADLRECQKESTKGSRPNINAITNRLYTKKCKETMNNWNDKVMRYCYKENEAKSNITIVNKLKPQPEQLYPFLYYPVRMSTATSLRNKQIR